jgi:hypothetical protein
MSSRQVDVSDCRDTYGIISLESICSDHSHEIGFSLDITDYHVEVIEVHSTVEIKIVTRETVNKMFSP